MRHGFPVDIACISVRRYAVLVGTQPFGLGDAGDPAMPVSSSPRSGCGGPELLPSVSRTCRRDRPEDQAPAETTQNLNHRHQHSADVGTVQSYGTAGNRSLFRTRPRATSRAIFWARLLAARAAPDRLTTTATEMSFTGVPSISKSMYLAK